MKLFVCAQDLGFFWIGLFSHQSFTILEKKEVAPERYLFSLDQFLKEHSIILKNLEGVIIVTGPGSFTSSRISLTIVNGIHFSHQIPLFTLSNPEYLPPEELMRRTHAIHLASPDEYAHVSYARPAHIT